MRSDPSQGGDCCWAFATAVYSRTSDRSGIRRLWDSLGKGFLAWCLGGGIDSLSLGTDLETKVPGFAISKFKEQPFKSSLFR